MITWEALDALSHQLELCGVGPRSSVVALLDDGPLANLVRAALARARADALDVRSVHPDAADEQFAANPLLPAVLERADVIIDAIAAFEHRDPPPTSRVLQLHHHAVDAHRWPPHANLARRVASAVSAIEESTTVRVQDRYGTDLEVRTADARLSSDAGRVVDAGEVASYPAGWVKITPASGRVDGDLVVMPGDANITRGAHIEAPIRLEIRNDLIIAIDGDHASADVLRALFEQFGRGDAYGVAALTVGLNPGRRREPALFDEALLDPVLARLGAGIVTLEFGENLHADRPCPGRIGLGLAGRTVTADDAALCADGSLTGDLAPDVYESPA